MEAARRLKKPHQNQPERQLLERPVKVRFTASSYGRFELVNTGVLRHPARFEMQFGDPLVVPAEKSNEVLRKVFLVGFGQRTDDAKVQRNITSKRSRIQTDLNIARMHVSVKEAVAKNLREEDRHAISGQLFHIDAGVAQALYLTDWNALHALHDHHVGHTVIPNHFGNHHQVNILHVAAQLR